ncbi:hypothetical protein [Acaryochloris sp. IP29b_bin.137]|uniref:hypothetical protein n=1 Tax=Acaryochloris sp. IP29b_bin.137 TaxID=2969217 RepID=UPI002624C99C|nr:hypothetical protein [Acaryochloris sp. IP29b_bin.137]
MTGPTGRRQSRTGKPIKSQQEKFREWVEKHKEKALQQGRQLEIEAWPESRLRDLILTLDISGGLREYFFNEIILSEQWFQEHLNKAKHLAGSRYTPELNVQTDLWKCFSALGRTNEWGEEFEKKIRLCKENSNHLLSQINRDNSTPEELQYLENCPKSITNVLLKLSIPQETIGNLSSKNYRSLYNEICSDLDELIDSLTIIEEQVHQHLKNQYGTNIDSAEFKQWMAENELSLPTINLDYVRSVLQAYQELCNWLKSWAGLLAFSDSVLITGVAGSGKTHGTCDAAEHRLSHGMLTCITFGHLFRGDPAPWTRMSEVLDLSIGLGMNGLLDALESAAEASGSFLILCIDAINETRPLRYWKDHLPNVIYEVHKRPFLRLCITCRTAFISSALPENHKLPIVEHHGFEGAEHDACNAFFQHYRLEPPIAPILQPEFKNPLYLKLLCTTLVAKKLRRIPSGWHGLSPIFREFLSIKEKQFADEYSDSVNSGANIIRNALYSIVREISTSGSSGLSWTQAQTAIDSKIQKANLPILEWLVRSDLLIEDAPKQSDDLFGSDSFVRPSFERLGDFLIAREIISQITEAKIHELFQPSSQYYYLVQDSSAVAQNKGILSALSIILPEKFDEIELPDLIKTEHIRSEVIQCTISSFSWREPNTFSGKSKELLCEFLRGKGELFRFGMDIALSISCRSSLIDAIWLHNFLILYPLAKRDAAWCGYLHKQYASKTYLNQLINAAFKIPLRQVNLEVSKRWAIILLWFTATSDRRVKDRATRALSALLASRSEIIPDILSLYLGINDDAVVERALLSCYGALILSRDLQSIKLSVIKVYETLQNSTECFDNAILRDHIRCLIELAQILDAFPKSYDASLVISPVSTDWPLRFPSDDQINTWQDSQVLPKLAYSCLEDDFFIYTMSCLREWEHGLDRNKMAMWILQEVVINLGYSDSTCYLFDDYMLGKFGGGRSRPAWAERIGKKYQLIAMYRLASKLCDHLERRRDDWAPEYQKIPLILLDQRNFDPTLPASVVNENPDTGTWWIKPQVNPRNFDYLSDAEWVNQEHDLPKMEDLLELIDQDSQKWRLLSAYPAWGHRDTDSENQPYRQIWIHLRSYIIPEEHFEELSSYLHKRNFFGQWMPEGSSRSYGFAGEYPWATSFNTEPDSYFAGGDIGPLSLSDYYVSSSNQLVVEWANDASLSHPFEIEVPSRTFFESNDLWWNGQDGYRLINAKNVFRDPSTTQSGPRSLIADNAYLLKKLSSLGMRLVWTMLGEKWILGGKNSFEPRPRKTFSQIAKLDQNGSIVFGERVFFEDYKQNACLSIEDEETTE